MSSLQERRDAEIKRYEDAYKSPQYFMKQWRQDHLNTYLTTSTCKFRNMLDVGCGRGESLEIAKKHGIEVVGVEVVPYLCDHKHVLHIDGAHDLSIFPDQGFDLVTALDVMEHILEEEVVEVIEEMWRVTKKALFLGIANNVSRYHITLHHPNWWEERIAMLGDKFWAWTPEHFDRDDYSYWEVRR